MRVLISAYACEPNKGSEPGAGWNWASAAAREHDVWVMTRTNNRSVLEEALAEDPNLNMRFIYLDLPAWARSWKRRGRGLRLYYILWQLLAARESRRLHQKHQFDLVHHLTFANVWLPALACVVDAPFVLGPVGGGPSVPVRLFPALGVRGTAHELLLRLARRLSRVNPLVRLSWSRADLIVCQNAETRAVLPKRYRIKTRIESNASVPPTLPSTFSPPGNDPQNRERQAIYAGRLAPWKGLALAIRAVALTADWRLLIVGDGPDRARLGRLATRLGVDSRVTFLDWCTQAKLWELLRSSDGLILPSLREDASFIAVEAGTLGVPVLAFDRGGPAVLRDAGLAPIQLLELNSMADAVEGLAHALSSCGSSHLGIDTDTALDIFRPSATVNKLEALYRLVAADPVVSPQETRPNSLPADG